MKISQFQCMFFSTLRLDDQRKQDTQNKAVDGFSLRRNHERNSHVGSSKTRFRSMMIWILMIVILSGAVFAEEDMEITLNGNQVLPLDLSSGSAKPAKPSKDVILALLFKTTQPSGTMFWADGKNGDFILVELVRGKLRYVQDFLRLFYDNFIELSIINKHSRIRFFIDYSLYIIENIEIEFGEVGSIIMVTVVSRN